MRIPFDSKYRDKIESGEYKVETRYGCSARIVCWDRVPKENNPKDLTLCVLIKQNGGESIYYYHTDGTKWVKEECFDLFIVTPEPEISEFENGMLRYLQDAANKKDDSKIVESTKEHSIKLLSLARNEFNKQIESDYREIIHGAYERGKADAEQEIERRLQSGELLTQEHHEKLMETLREECKKDLPRWRQVEADKEYPGCVARYMDINGDWNYCMSSGKVSDDCEYISFAALERLPKVEDHE